MGKAAVNGYADHYDSIDGGHTQSLVKASAMNQLPALTDAFGAAVMAANEKALARTSRDATINYAYDENRDLGDFVRRVVAGTKSAAVKAKGQALLSFIGKDLVLLNRTRDAKASYWSEAKEYTLSQGIAAYFPKAGLGNGYTDLAWAKASKWSQFTLWMNQP